MYTHTTQKQHLTKNHSRHSSRIARKVSRAAQTKEARQRNLAAVQHSQTIQAKLTIGQPNDVYEQEADRVAEQVMRMSTPPSEQMRHGESEPVQNQTKTAVVLPQIQVKTGQAEQATPVSPQISADISALHGGGQPLPAVSRKFFEPRFGADFSGVRLHTDSRAADAAYSINAKAFTVGQDVAFGTGQFAPENAAWKKLLAHELTHVVQQGAAETKLQYVPNQATVDPVKQKVMEVAGKSSFFPLYLCQSHWACNPLYQLFKSHRHLLNPKNFHGTNKSWPNGLKKNW